MVYGNGGKYGIVSNVESATYRFYRPVVGSNPTLSANYNYFKINNLTCYVVVHVRVSYETQAGHRPMFL